MNNTIYGASAPLNQDSKPLLPVDALQTIENQKDLLVDLREFQALIAVCASALNNTNTTEDIAVVDVLHMTANKFWILIDEQEKKIKAMELVLEGNE